MPPEKHRIDQIIGPRRMELRCTCGWARRYKLGGRLLDQVRAMNKHLAKAPAAN